MHGSGLFVLMSQWGNNDELALQHAGFVPRDRLLQKAYFDPHSSHNIYSMQKFTSLQLASSITLNYLELRKALLDKYKYKLYQRSNKVKA